VAHPTLISESGRALVAPYGVLLFNILASSERLTHHAPADGLEPLHDYTKNIRDMIGEVTPDNWRETVNDSIFYRDQVRAMLECGKISLRERAFAERCFNHIMVKVLAVSETMDEIPEELADLQRSLADIYYGNFSLFQSLPDVWSIDQIFPVMPIHRLDEKPTRRALIADITCDCDGKIDRFIADHETNKQLPLHELRNDEDYIIGVFMVGAYQETLGDLHNLFGDTNVVSIESDEAGKIVWSHMVKGDTAADVLSYVEYEPKQMIRQFQAVAERAVSKGLISPAERREVGDAYENGMRGYTYFED
jgi:arginine decarboxylase